MAAGGAAGAGAGVAAAAAEAAARRRRQYIIREVLKNMESVKCPLCGQGTLLPLFTSSATNWICSRPDCSYIVHQHGSKSSKVWKGEAARDKADSRGAWFETP